MMLLGAFCMIVANAATLQGAWAIVRRLRAAPSRLDPMLFLLVRLGLVSAAVLASAALGVLSPAVLGVAGALALAGMAAAGEHRSLPSLRLRGIPPWALAAAALIGLRLLAQVWFFAPYTTDVLSYHLPQMAEWVRSGTLFGERGVDDHATFPAGFELVEAWWVLFLHHDVLIEMAGVEFLLLAAASTSALGSGLGLTPAQGRLAGLITLLSPGLYFQATSGLNDGATAAVVLAAAALLLARAPLVLVLAAVGFGAGIKATFLFALPGLLILRKWGEPPDGPAWSRGRLGIAAAGVALALGGYWYAENAVLHGNPIYPVGDKALPVQAGPRIGSLGRNLAELITVRLSDDQAPAGAHLDRSAGWGAVAFGCGLLALLVLARAERRFRIALLAFATGLAGVLLCVAHDDWFGRFTLFFPALTAVATLKLMERVPQLLWVVGVAVCFQVAATFLPYDVPPKTFRLLAGQGWRDRSTAATFGAEVQAATVGYLAGNRGPAYVLYGPDLARKVVYLRASDPSALAKTLAEQRVELIYAAKNLTEAQTDALMRLSRHGHLTEERPGVWRVAQKPLDPPEERR